MRYREKATSPQLKTLVIVSAAPPGISAIADTGFDN
jgi:hypothetical protein